MRQPHKYSFKQWLAMTIAMWGFMSKLTLRKRVSRMWEIIKYTVHGGPLVWVLAGTIFVSALAIHRIRLRFRYNRMMRDTGIPFQDGAGVTHFLSPAEERAKFDAEAEALFKSEADKKWRERW